MVGWANGGGVRDVVSQGQGTLSNPTEHEAAKREDKDSASSGPVVDVDVDAGVDSSDLDGASGGVSVTPAGEEGQVIEDNSVLVSGDVDVRAGIIPEELHSEELQLQPHGSSLPMPSPHAVAASTATFSGPGGPDPLEADAVFKNGNRNNDCQGKISGGHPTKVSVNAPNGGGMHADARGVAEEQMTAHGTGTKAVRSLSRGGGGGGGGVSIEMEGEAQTIFESEALTSTHVANSCGESLNRRRRTGTYQRTA